MLFRSIDAKELAINASSVAPLSARTVTNAPLVDLMLILIGDSVELLINLLCVPFTYVFVTTHDTVIKVRHKDILLPCLLKR